ncbi:MAG TPA: MarR family transcriptional regulator [Methanomassiliicoccales archaeon]|nr:MarR family transcriptional regulator [Methanomassiliicoccales archaeon]
MQEVELLGKYFSRIYRFSKAYQDRELKHLGIGSGQFGFMMILLRTEGISQSRLSEISKLDKTTIARSIRPLIENGYVVRGKDPDDRRGYKLLLTDSGRSLGPELIRIQLDLERQLLENFTSEEIELLSGFLRRMNENASKLK